MAERKRLYLDHAASTPVVPEVIRVMAPYWREKFGNAGSIYAEGVEAKRVLEESRASVAGQISAHADEIVFTSGGTESNNLAIFGCVEAILRGEPQISKSVALRARLSDLHFITSAIEHPSVIDCFKNLEEKGALVTYCGVNERGLSDPKEVRDALRGNTVLVSIAYVNNEIGTIQPIQEISKVIAQKKKEHFFTYPIPHTTPYSIPYLHTDASQAPLYLDCRVEKLCVDMMTIDGQKMYGPKGVGFLYVKRKTPLAPIMIGGSQERGLRPGTPVIPLVAGLAKAFELADLRRTKETKRLAILRDHTITEIQKYIPRAILNGDPKQRLPNNINVSFPGVLNEFLVLQLDAKGISVGTRSACLPHDDSGSPVIKALGAGKDRSRSSIRITLGIDTTRKDISRLVETLYALLRRPT